MELGRYLEAVRREMMNGPTHQAEGIFPLQGPTLVDGALVAATSSGDSLPESPGNLAMCFDGDAEG